MKTQSTFRKVAFGTLLLLICCYSCDNNNEKLIFDTEEINTHTRGTEMIKPGMSANEVIKLIGEPVRKINHGSTQPYQEDWSYGTNQRIIIYDDTVCDVMRNAKEEGELIKKYVESLKSGDSIYKKVMQRKFDSLLTD